MRREVESGILKNKLFGLILAGGRSKRMGKDKGKLVYHQSPQRTHAFNMLNAICNKTFYSIREDQIEEFDDSSNIIIDDNKYKGPYNGIMSAHNKFPNVPWLVLATDLPLLQLNHLKKLVHYRNPDKLATAYATSTSSLPEPLVAIWEPKGLRLSQNYLSSNEGSCPRKFLINNEVQLVYPDNDLVLMNANTQADLDIAQEKLQQ